jgi:hypothetical protein
MLEGQAGSAADGSEAVRLDPAGCKDSDSGVHLGGSRHARCRRSKARRTAGHSPAQPGPLTLYAHPMRPSRQLFHPRPYQERAVREVLTRYDGGARKLLLHLPTGAGKTAIATLIIERLLPNDRRGQNPLHFEYEEAANRIVAQVPGLPQDLLEPICTAFESASGLKIEIRGQLAFDFL